MTTKLDQTLFMPPAKVVTKDGWTRVSLADMPKILDVATRSLGHVTYDIDELDLTGTQLRDDDIEVIVKRYPNVRKLILTRNHVGDKGVEKLAGLSKLEYLDLAQTGIGDEGLLHVSRMARLETLILSSNNSAISVGMTNKGLKVLAQLPNLRRLDLAYFELDHQGVKNLRALKSLTSLNLSHNSLEDKHLSNVAEITSLRELNLCYSRVTCAGLDHLAGLPQLERLNLNWTRLGDTSPMWQSLRALQDCRALRHLDIGKTHLNARAIADLTRIPQLESLNLECNRIAYASLKHISHLRSLKHLNLDTNEGVNDKTLRTLQDLTGLESLSLNGASVSDDGLAVLRNFWNLRELNLLHLDITDNALSHLRDLRELESLYISNSNSRMISDKGLAHLSRLHKMRRFSVDFVPVTDAGLIHLADMNHLEYLGLRGTQVTGTGFQNIVDMPLTSINLLDVAVNDCGAATLSLIRTLESVHFWHANLTGAGLRALGSLDCLRQIRLSQSVVDQGNVSLRQVFPHCGIHT